MTATTTPPTVSVHVCVAESCLAVRGRQVLDALSTELDGQPGVVVKGVGCLGLCSAGALVQIHETGRLLERTEPDRVEPVVAAVAEAVAGAPPVALPPFFTRQVRVVTEHVGRIDPESLEDSVAHGGYGALEQALRRPPGALIDEVTKSGLRGRGGAGYPTGLKWATVAKAVGSPKYIVCNADEGDPGAFMDRSVMESDPHRLLEGMALAAYAVGASRGFIYCRAEYPLALHRLGVAIRQAEASGYLGSRFAGSRFPFTVEFRVGAGAFVCGEETALIASIQGGRGTPRPRPPYPATAGLWEQPTLINNVETLAAVPAIARNGGDWYAGIGTPASHGTKVFALAGRVNNTGLIEVPMGITFREIVYDIGGGIVGGRAFKAVQTGGPSGGCLPEKLLDMPVEYETLAAAGSIMGSGGMVVLDDSVCMLDIARYFMDFSRDESCGKCVPCRVGTTQLSMLLDDICEGRSSRAGLAQLEELADMVHHTSLCGLGHAAPNPVFSTLRWFRDEYLAHIDDGVCPAGVCGAPDFGCGPVNVHTLTIDGVAVAGAAGQTLLAVAEEVGIDIPTLCHFEGLSDVGACRLCMVEIAGSPRPQLACMTPAADDMTVVAHSDRLLRYRQMIVEMLFVERNHVCAVCVANRNCELQDLASGLGLTHFELPEIHPRLVVDASHDLFAVDHNRCVLCTRCVRVCDEIEGAHTWDVQGHGIGARVVTDLGTPWGVSDSCTSCGKCVQVCPTGALFEKGRAVGEGARKERPLPPPLARGPERGP